MRAASLWLAVVTLLLFHPEPARAASTTNSQAGLRLRGTVKSLVVEQQASGSSYVVVGLRYELTNTGGPPIILWNRRGNSGGPWPYAFTGLTLSRTPGFNREDILDSYLGGPSVSDGPEWDAMHKALDQPSPPADATIIMWPNHTIVFDAEVTIVCRQNRHDSVPDHPTLRELEEEGTFWLRASYEVWSPNLERNRRERKTLKFGRKLQRRWKEFGTLVLDDTHTEPVQVDLKTAIYKVPSR